jgi:hypothetical protein
MPNSQEAHEILAFFSRNKGQLFSIKEISRGIDRQRFREDRMWARVPLAELFAEGHIKRDDSGYYFMAASSE